MNINNFKTGSINIPGALHSTGGDGDGYVGNVVAYSGDVYDTSLAKNQAEINSIVLTDDNAYLKLTIDGVEVTRINGHDYVDMGIKDSNGYPVLWATMNLGATKPEDAGSYYAWGETTPKSSYSQSNYKYIDSTSTSIYPKYTKYNSSYTGTSIDLADDCANANFGGDWRLPTRNEWFKLCLNVSWSYNSTDKYYKLKSRVSGYTDNYIIFPIGGYFDTLVEEKTGYFCAYYWCSDVDVSNVEGKIATCITRTKDSIDTDVDAYPYAGYSVRPVITLYPNGKFIPEPTNDGTSGLVLTTDGNGGRTWKSVMDSSNYYTKSDIDTKLTHYSTTDMLGYVQQSINDTKSNLQNQINDKLETLTAGTNITITDDTVSFNPSRDGEPYEKTTVIDTIPLVGNTYTVRDYESEDTTATKSITSLTDITFPVNAGTIFALDGTDHTITKINSKWYTDTDKSTINSVSVNYTADSYFLQDTADNELTVNTYTNGTNIIFEVYSTDDTAVYYTELGLTIDGNDYVIKDGNLVYSETETITPVITYYTNNDAYSKTEVDNACVHKTGDEEISDIKNFTDGIISGKGNSIASTDGKQLHIFGNDNTIEGSGQYAYNEATIMGYSNYLTGNGIQANRGSFTVGSYNIGDGSKNYGGSENITLGQYNNSSGSNNIMIGGDYNSIRLTGDANATTYEISRTTDYKAEEYNYLVGAKLFTSYPTDIVATVQSVQKATDDSNITITLDKTLNEATALSNKRVYTRYSTISGEYNVNIGSNTVSGEYNYVYGGFNYTSSRSSDNSLIGTHNSTTSSYNYILGCNNTSGTYTKDSKNYSGNNTILGEYNTVNGMGNYVIGYYNTAQSWGNYVLGYENTLDYSNNAVVGIDNKCSSYNNYILGAENTTTGHYIAILGNNNTINNNSIYALGEGLTSATDGETLIGKYNLANAGNLITIGNGTESAKSNYAEVKTDGSTYIKGIGGYDGTNRDSASSIQTVISGKVDNTETITMTATLSDGTTKTYTIYGKEN